MKKEKWLNEETPEIDLAYVRERYRYDPENGILFDIVRNEEVPRSNKRMKISSKSDPRNVYITCDLQKLIVYLHTDKTETHVRFIDGDHTNRKWSNIHIVPHHLIMSNRKIRKDSKYRYKGVRLKENKWTAILMHQYKFYTVNGLSSEEDAAKYYDAMARHYFGKEGKTNFQEEYIPTGDESFLRKYQEYLKLKSNVEISNKENFNKEHVVKIKKKTKNVSKDSPMEVLDAIRKKFYYDKETGEVKNIKTGYVIVSKDVYVSGRFEYEYNISKHRLIWFLNYGYVPDLIDHIDRNHNNDRIENLREATPQQNACNVTRRAKKWGYWGVYMEDNKYGASLKYKKNDYTIQGFDSAEIASHYYDSLSRYYHGEFGVPNHEEVFIPPMSIEDLRKYRDESLGKETRKNPMEDSEFLKQLEERKLLV